MAKFRYYPDKLPYKNFYTQPNMSFTPRQIIEQFASGEMVVQENQPSDDLYDDKLSDDDLSNLNIVTDDFVARQLSIDYLTQSEENVKGGKSISNGSNESSIETNGIDPGTAATEPSTKEGSE